MENNRTVLLLEDDLDLISIIQYILEEENYRVVVSNPCKYRKDFIEFQPDIILLDHWLCFSVGKNICEDIKADPATGSIPLILTTTFNDLCALGQNCIPDDVIYKPFDIEVLVRKVNRWMDDKKITTMMSIKKPRITADR